jgi:flagellar motor switch protein FliN/FliY
MDQILSNEELEMLLEKHSGNGPVDEVQEEKPKEMEEVFTEFEYVKADKTDTPRNLELLLDIPLEISVVLGKTRKSIREITNVVPGSVIELEKPIEEPLEICANGKKIAEGEAIVINEKFCVRITKIMSKRELIKNL